MISRNEHEQIDEKLATAESMILSEIRTMFPEEAVRLHNFNEGSVNKTIEVEVAKPGSMNFYISAGTPGVGEIVFYAENDSSLGHDWVLEFTDSLDGFREQLHWLLDKISKGELEVLNYKLLGYKLGISQFSLKDGQLPKWVAKRKSVLSLLASSARVRYKSYESRS